MTEAAPAGTVTDAGTVIEAGALVVRETATPPVPTLPDRVTVPVDDDPPSTVVGLSVMPCNPDGFTVKVAV